MPQHRARVFFLTCSVVLHLSPDSCSCLLPPTSLMPLAGCTHMFLGLSSASSCLDGHRVSHTLLPLGCHPQFALFHCLTHHPYKDLRQKQARSYLQPKPILPHTSHHLGLGASRCLHDNWSQQKFPSGWQGRECLVTTWRLSFWIPGSLLSMSGPARVKAQRVVPLS